MYSIQGVIVCVCTYTIRCMCRYIHIYICIKCGVCVCIDTHCTYIDIKYGVCIQYMVNSLPLNNMGWNWLGPLTHGWFSIVSTPRYSI